MRLCDVALPKQWRASGLTWYLQRHPKLDCEEIACVEQPVEILGDLAQNDSEVCFIAHWTETLIVERFGDDVLTKLTIAFAAIGVRFTGHNSETFPTP